MIYHARTIKEGGNIVNYEGALTLVAGILERAREDISLSEICEESTHLPTHQLSDCALVAMQKLDSIRKKADLETDEPGELAYEVLSTLNE